MKKRNIFIPLLLIYILFDIRFTLISQSDKTDSFLLKKLKELPDITKIIPIKPDSLYTEAYEILIKQPINHDYPADGYFSQHIYLSNNDINKPMLMETEGYAVFNGQRARELSRILKCNQVVVEHRYFGKSKPDSLIWKFLTLEQSAKDLHHINKLLKTIYKGKWISTGISKGGQTTLLYKYFYPNDVDVSVPYVAPVPIAQEDPRIFTFLRSVGSDSCREKIKQFQKEMLERSGEMIPLLKEFAEKNKQKFSIGFDVAYEYIVLEYSFSFWQWGNSSCSAIPQKGSPKEKMFEHLNTVVPFRDYTDNGIEFLRPFMYQAYTELGYYCYEVIDFKHLLKAVKNATNIIFAPNNTPLVYNCETMQNINRWLQNEGDNIIYIYGELDTWSACAVQLTGKTNALKIVKKNGSHGTRIGNLPQEQKELVFSILEKWLELKIDR
jgi:hypothetical protein